MNQSQAEALLLALGSKAQGKGDNWVRGSCPLAPQTHKSGSDKTPSFGLYVAEGEPGRFHCFSCESGSLGTLLQKMNFLVQQMPNQFHGNLLEAMKIVDDEEIDLPLLPAFSEFGTPTTKPFEELPSWYLDEFKPATEYDRAAQYLSQRLVPLDHAAKYDLRYDAVADRLVFPYRDVFGRLAGLRGRGIQFLDGPSHPSPHHDYVWNGVNNAAQVWYNEPLLDIDAPKPVVVVEGQFDAMRVAQVYPWVIANLTAKPGAAKLDKLFNCEGVILMLDGDHAGRVGTEKFGAALAARGINWCPVYLPILNSQGQPVDSKSPEAIKTDPDKMGEAWIRDALLEVGVISC